MPRKSSGRYTSRALLQGHTLIVPVYGLLRVDLERALTLTMWTEADLYLSRGILVKRPKDSFTFHTVKLDIFELWEHTRASGDHT